jgi:hypothetical protein
MKIETITPFREAKNCFSIMTVSKSPWKITVNSKDSWTLSDADNVNLFNITLCNESMATISELVGTRFVIENSVFWLRGLLKYIEELESVIHKIERNTSNIQTSNDGIATSVANIEDYINNTISEANSLRVESEDKE